MLKICSSCGESLEINMFSIRKLSKDGFNRKCKVCMTKEQQSYYAKIKEVKSEKSKEWYQNNKELAAKRQKLYQKSNKEIIKERRQANKEPMAVYGKEYRKRNKTVLAIKHKKYHEDNIEKVKEYYKINKAVVAQKQKIYAKNNRDKYRNTEQKRQAEKKQLPHTLTVDQWQSIKLHFENCCAYCGKKLPLEQEHLLALSKGGEYTNNNIIPACKSCNCSKGNNDFFIWYPKHKNFSTKREKYILKFLNYENGQQQLKII